MRPIAIFLVLIVGFVFARAVGKAKDDRDEIQEKPDVQFPALVFLEGEVKASQDQGSNEVDFEELPGGKIRVRRRKRNRRRKGKNRRKRPKYMNGFEMIIFG
ncbi:unnamed protein product [Caenorhabditis brenneri]